MQKLNIKMQNDKLKFKYFIIIFIAAVTLTTGCTTIYNPATGKEETYFISDEMEIAIGNNMANQIIQDNKISDDKQLLLYVETIGEEIASAGDRNYLQYHFYIIENEEMNAFALPGGYIFVNTGLIDKVNKDELSFVLAHEIGHISARHSIKRLQTTLGLNLLLSIALRDVNSKAINDTINIIYNVVELGYSRADEILADSLAVRYTQKSGYNPAAGISLLEKLENEDDTASYQLVFLSSHPLPKQRRENIIKQIEIIGQKLPLN